MTMGQSGAGSTPMVDGEILADSASGPVLSVPVTPNAEDPDDASKVLKPGTILTKITSGGDSGLYKQYEDTASDGSEDESTAVVLKDTIDLDDPQNDDKTMATVYTEGTFKEEAIIVDSNFDYSKQQNITVWPQ